MALIKKTSRWDFLISPSETATKRFKSAFNLKEEQILTLGYPRNDDLVQLNNEDYINQLKQKYEIPSHKKSYCMHRHGEIMIVQI